jgi:hypothetical protein
MKNFFFGTESLRRQAYIQFFAALIGFPTSFFLPQNIQITVITAISWWAIIISGQTFIAATEANKKAENIEAENVSADTIKADHIETGE